MVWIKPLSCGCNRHEPCSEAHRYSWELWLENIAESIADGNR